MADTLDGLLNDCVEFDDFKAWLVSDSAENFNEKADFISYFLNYIREKCAWLISKNIKGLESPSLKGRSRDFSFPPDSGTEATKSEARNKNHNNEDNTKSFVSFNNTHINSSAETKPKRTECFNDVPKIAPRDRTAKPSCSAKKSLNFDSNDGSKMSAHNSTLFKENINNFDDFPPLGNKPNNVNGRNGKAFPPFDRKSNSNKSRGCKQPRRLNPTPVLHSNQGTAMFGSSKFFTPPEKKTNEVFQKTPLTESPSLNLQSEREILKINKNIISQTISIEPSIPKLESSSPKKPASVNYVIPDPEKVCHKKILEEFSSIYEILITNGLVPNVTSELYFIFELLTSKIHENQMPNDSEVQNNIFSSIHNCIYFAVTILSKLQNLLNLLDENTLLSLCEVPFLSKFSSQLVDFLRSCCEDKQKVTFKSPSLSRVPFLIEEDSKENFIDNRAFDSFKKQRDLFYELLRDWHQQSSNNLKPKFQDNFFYKAKQLIDYGPNAVNLFHLARLFQNQMIASCNGLDVNEVYDEFLIDIQKNNPEKLKKLRERFKMPYCVGEPNPPPTFYGIQSFFSELILAISSPIFNQQLQDIFVCKILDLNDADIFSDEELSSLETVKEKYIFLLHTLRLLGKFLGYLYFLPYKVTEPLATNVVNSLLKSRKHSVPPLDVLKILKKSVENNRVILTVPWIVEYLSMIDPASKILSYIEETLGILVSIYRGHYIFSPNSMNFWFLRIMIGWLFDVLKYPSEYNTLLQPIIFEKNVKCEGLDFLAIIDKQLLHFCCPYLMEFKVLVHSFLNDIKKDKNRKITTTTLSTTKPHRAILTPLTKHQTEIQLEENFFFLHPPSLKKTVEFVSERMASKVINRIRSEITEFKLHSIEFITNQETYKDLIHSQTSNAIKLKSFIDSSILELYEKSHSKIENFIKVKCLEDIENIMPSLLADDVKPTVIEKCCKISFRSAVDKITDWCSANLELLEIQKDIKNKLNHLSKGEGEVVAPKDACLSSVIDNLRQSVVKINSNIDITDDLSKTLAEVSNLIKKDIVNIAKKLIIHLTVDLYIAFLVVYPEKCDSKLNSSFIPVWSQSPKAFDLESYFMTMQNMKYFLVGKKFNLTTKKFLYMLSCLISDKIFEVEKLRNALSKQKAFYQNDSRLCNLLDKVSLVLESSKKKEPFKGTT